MRSMSGSSITHAKAFTTVRKGALPALPRSRCASSIPRRRYRFRFAKPQSASAFRSTRLKSIICNHFLLRPAGFGSGPQHSKHLGGEYLDQMAAVPASECRSLAQGEPMRPAFRLLEARMCDADPAGLQEKAQGHSRSLELCLRLRPITDAARHCTGVACIRALPRLPRPISLAA